MNKTEKVMPLVGQLIDREFARILRPVLMKRIGLYLQEIEQMRQASLCQPTYYVVHPDGTYSVADPQP
jgi:hypothetical protein